MFLMYWISIEYCPRVGGPGAVHYTDTIVLMEKIWIYVDMWIYVDSLVRYNVVFYYFQTMKTLYL